MGLTDGEKKIMLTWQYWQIRYDMMRSMEVTGVEAIKEYFRACDAVKTIEDERIAALAKVAFSIDAMPNVHMTKKNYETILKPWKAKLDAAQDELLTISFEYGDTIPRT
jgi:5,10-methylenetetrahydrofolate reductase